MNFNAKPRTSFLDAIPVVFCVLATFFSAQDANNMRLLCKETRDLTSHINIDDPESRIYNFELWKSCFFNSPKSIVGDLDGGLFRVENATGAKNITLHMSNAYNFRAESFKSIKDAQSIYVNFVFNMQIFFNSYRLMPNLVSMKFSEEHLIHLYNVPYLHLVGMRYKFHGDKLAYLKNATTLILRDSPLGVDMDRIRDSSFRHLSNINTLVLANCSISLSDLAFTYLKNVNMLILVDVNMRFVTAELKNILSLIPNVLVFNCSTDMHPHNTTNWMSNDFFNNFRTSSFPKGWYSDISPLFKANLSLIDKTDFLVL